MEWEVTLDFIKVSLNMVRAQLQKATCTSPGEDPWSSSKEPQPQSALPSSGSQPRSAPGSSTRMEWSRADGREDKHHGREPSLYKKQVQGHRWHTGVYTNHRESHLRVLTLFNIS